jgi:hypothetical protein
MRLSTTLENSYDIHILLPRSIVSSIHGNSQDRGKYRGHSSKSKSLDQKKRGKSVVSPVLFTGCSSIHWCGICPSQIRYNKKKCKEEKKERKEEKRDSASYDAEPGTLLTVTNSGLSNFEPRDATRFKKAPAQSGKERRGIPFLLCFLNLSTIFIQKSSAHSISDEKER